MGKRKIVQKELGQESFYDLLDGKTFDEVGLRLHELKTSYQGRDVFFSVEGYGYDGGIELYLYERRAETDQEYSQRLAKEKKEREKSSAAKKAKKDREYAEYMRLKEKFEG